MVAEHPDSRKALWFSAAFAVGACVAPRTSNTPGTSPTAASSQPVTGSADAGATVNTPLAPASDTPNSGTALTTAEPDAASAAAISPVMPDIDYWATPQPVVDKMLELAKVTASDVVYDLGCGDARSLITAAQRYGARGVGFDIDPRLVQEARESARRNGVDQLVKIEQADIFTLDLSPASVIFLYITPRFNLRLVPQFKKLLRGSRIVSHEFEIPGAKPARVVHVRGPHDGPPDADQPNSTMMHKIYLWNMPWQKQWTDWKVE